MARNKRYIHTYCFLSDMGHGKMLLSFSRQQNNNKKMTYQGHMR